MPRRLVGAAVLIVLGPALLASVAQADVTAVMRDAERLRLELRSLRQTWPIQAENPAVRAQDELRLGRLEEELRLLTGRIEELEFRQRQTEERVDQLVADLDQRLGALEQGGPVAGEAGPGDAASADPTAGDDPAQALEDLATEEGAAAPPSDQGTLGSVPESAVAGLPRPALPTAEPPQTTLSAEQQYEASVNLLRGGNYPGAQEGLELFLDLHPEHELASNAAYWLAETQYVRKNYVAAAQSFARNYGEYGKSAPKAADNLLKLGMSLANLGENDRACQSYDVLASEFPNAPAPIQQALARERARAQCGS